jgi:hypothetical protein
VLIMPNDSTEKSCLNIVDGIFNDNLTKAKLR